MGRQLQKFQQKDRKQKAEQKLEVLLLEGLLSGEPTLTDSAYWKRKRRKLARRRITNSTGSAGPSRRPERRRSG